MTNEEQLDAEIRVANMALHYALTPEPDFGWLYAGAAPGLPDNESLIRIVPWSDADIF